MKEHMTVKMPIHSVIDLITNSSTEIFVDCTNSIEPTKELLQEFLKLNGSDLSVDDVFDISIEKDENDILTYFEYCLEYNHEDIYHEYQLNTGSWEERHEKIKKLFEEYQKGNLDIEIIGDVRKYLKIKVKDEKYSNFINLLDKFLYSPDSNLAIAGWEVPAFSANCFCVNFASLRNIIISFAISNSFSSASYSSRNFLFFNCLLSKSLEFTVFNFFIIIAP